MVPTPRTEQPAAVRTGSRGSRLLGSTAALLTSGVPVLLLVAVVETTTDTVVRVVAALLLIQLPVAVGVWLSLARRGSQAQREFGAVTDLEERAHRAEEALDREHDRLHQLRATVAGFGLAHQLLSDPAGRLPPDERAHLQRLHDCELGRLERLLSDERPCESEVVDLGEVIDPLVGVLRLRGHPLSWAGTRIRARARRDEVAEIVHVLLENAARHGSGSTIRVEASRTGHEVEVRVRDRGPGVAPALRGRLFERGARSARSPGQGIGLHIASRLAAEMGGELRHEAAHRDAGTTFVLTLRAA